MRAEVLQNGLRRKAVEIVRLCAKQYYDASLEAATEYHAMIQNEICRAKAAVASVENMLDARGTKQNVRKTRHNAAEALGVTSETLRTWERNGLLTVRRGENGYRVYSAADMERLNIIRTLRCANYSLSSILRLLNNLDRRNSRSVEEILNTAEPGEDIISVCDRLIISLESTAKDADMMICMIEKIKIKYPTPQ